MAIIPFLSDLSISLKVIVIIMINNYIRIFDFSWANITKDLYSYLINIIAIEVMSMKLKKSILFIFVVIILDFLILLIFNTFSKTITNDRIENGIQNIDSITFTINDIDSIDFSFIKESGVKNISLFKKSKSNDLLSYEMIYNNSAIYKAIDGRIFSSDDFDNHVQTAIIGKDLFDMISNKNQISINENTYEVIGKFNFNNKTACSIFYTNANIKSVNCDTEFVIDGMSKKNIANLYKVIKNEVENKKGYVEVFVVENGSLLDAFKYSKVLYYTIILMLSLYILFISCITMIWSKNQSSWIMVNWLLGNNKMYMPTIYITALNIISHLISISIFRIVYQGIPFSVIKVFFISLIIAIILTLLYGYKTKKQLIYNFRGVITW